MKGGFESILLQEISRVSESIRQDIGQFHSPQMKPCKSADYFVPRFQLGEVFFCIKNIFIMKTLTGFRKMKKSGVGLRLSGVFHL